MAALIVKVTDGTDIRRFTARADMTFAQLRKRVGKDFGLEPPERAFKLVYKDDEGDQITLASDDDFAEAVSIALKLEPAVLRLTVSGCHVPDSSRARAEAQGGATIAPDMDLSALIATITSQLPAFVSQLPQAIHHLVSNAKHVSASFAAESPAAPTAHPEPQHLEGFHPGVTCDKTGMCPIVGLRYNLKGQDYDLCQSEFDVLPPTQQDKFVCIPPPRFRHHRAKQLNELGVHPGIVCDKSGMSPIIGMRYHLPGQNYDICQAEFDKLPLKEQQPFVRIPPPISALASYRPCRGAMKEDKEKRGDKKKAARFISDVSIHDGMQMAPDTTFTKIWKIKNTGTDAWPMGTRLMFVNGDMMGSTQASPVFGGKCIEPGQEVDVAVEMNAPKEMGRYISYWRLVGPYGRKFGQRVWCHIQVIDPDSQPELPNEQDFEQLKIAERGGETDDEEITDAKTDAPREPGPSSTGSLATEVETDLAKSNPEPGNATADVVMHKMADKEMAVTLSDEAMADTEKMAVGPETKTEPLQSSTTQPSTLESVAIALATMGFSDESLIKAVVAKNGPELEVCVDELASLSEWDTMLTDLEEMGFTNRTLNCELLLQQGGCLKRTVKELVATVH
mmetsp:Transcript_73196/g.122228  ORF Transcript_73196/g.122228 Transcript_73196/m.122228 type:complete len:620 (-) Transcript_73196:486-2345(-)